MKRTNWKNHIRVLAVVFTIVLSMAGVGYGTWAGSISINVADPNMGNLDVQFVADNQQTQGAFGTGGTLPATVLLEDPLNMPLPANSPYAITGTRMALLFTEPDFGALGDHPLAYSESFEVKVQNFGTVPAAVTLNPTNSPEATVTVGLDGYSANGWWQEGDNIILQPWGSPHDHAKLSFMVTMNAGEVQNLANQRGSLTLFTLDAKQALDLPPSH